MTTWRQPSTRPAPVKPTPAPDPMNGPAAQTKAAMRTRSAARRSRKRQPSLHPIELVQRRVAAATATWKQAKEHAAQAKRRKKLARLLARRAKKDARRAKENLEKLRHALAEAQAATPPSRRGAAAPEAMPRRQNRRVRKASMTRRDLRAAAKTMKAALDEAIAPHPTAPEKFPDEVPSTTERSYEEIGQPPAA